MYTKRLLDRLRLKREGGGGWREGGFTLNPPKKDSPRYNRVLRIYLSGTIYNADINRPYGSGLSSPNRQIQATKVKLGGRERGEGGNLSAQRTLFAKARSTSGSALLFHFSCCCVLIRFIIINVIRKIQRKNATFKGNKKLIVNLCC